MGETSFVALARATDGSLGFASLPTSGLSAVHSTSACDRSSARYEVRMVLLQISSKGQEILSIILKVRHGIIGKACCLEAALDVLFIEFQRIEQEANGFWRKVH